MSDASILLGLPYIQPAQAQKHVTHNEAVRRLDRIVQLAVIGRDAAAPPTGPLEGDRHIVAGVGSGDWVGRGGSVAIFDAGIWTFETPRAGWQAWVIAEAQAVVFDSEAGWQAAGAPGGGNGGPVTATERLGINASADTQNRLAVSAAATLLTHEGAGHQLKLNKATAGDTASLLFQTGFSGRAEMGTAGSDGFAVKVSADGAVWNTGLAVDPADGRLAAPNGLTVDGALEGSAVSQGPGDTTPERLIRTADGYVRGTILAPVAQTGGIPTGGVIERGATAGGDYVRFADGTQICTSPPLASGPIDTAAGALFQSAAMEWTFPRPFAPDTVPVVAGEGGSTGAWPTIGTHGALGVSFKAIGVTSFAEGLELRLVATGRWL